jgi:hypothetical protein
VLSQASAWAECPIDFTLAASYPRRAVRRSDAEDQRTLADVGLASRQEALFVEL